MNARNLTRILMLAAVIVSALGMQTPAHAQELGAQIIIRSTTFWDAVFNGTVNANRYERWSLQLVEAESFTISVIATSGNLTPNIYLLDANDNEISMVTGNLSNAVLSASQPAGEYYIQIQPNSGEGTYLMEITRTEQVNEPGSAVMLNPASVLTGGTSIGTVMLTNVPTSGYASAEFICTYDPALISISNIADAGLFGSDPAAVTNGPANGSFIFAVAGSNGQRATDDGAVFSFTVTALAAGQAQISCVGRVSTGGALQELAISPATLTITEPLGTLTGSVTASKPVTVTLYKQDGSVQTTATPDANGNFSIQAPAGVYTVIASAIGHLKAQGNPTLTAGTTTALQTVALPAGDIDGNDVIDQFDALTIGMNYNLASPSAADLNNDGTINVLDLEILAANYHQAGALAWQ
ncbi:MAG: carboxypeptidase regulatory-like domain-containing protein [Anaerolineales bacterium]|nr:carboxypeptidase regulatory-like domain-containing protein [Anaerolineales bacterium]MCB9145055.1 carboxypeptidase regulatory-like domain-containing protein [Anaerolineales bacterium]